MLLRTEVTHASDVELLTVILGKRWTAETLLKKTGGSLLALLFATPQENGDMFCAQGSSAYAADAVLAASRARACRASDRGGLRRPDWPSSPGSARPARLLGGRLTKSSSASSLPHSTA